MPCCKILIVLIALFLIVVGILLIILYNNQFRIKYLDLKMWFRGAYKPQKVGSYYDQWHSRYADVYGDTIQSFRSEDLNLLHQYVMQSAGIKDGMAVLDAGCGVGGPAIYFAQHADIHIEGLTISEKQAEEASKNIKKQKLANRIKVQADDFHLLDKIYPPNHFDVILFLESYGHAQSPERLMKAAFSVLKKGGHIYLKDYFKKDLPKNRLQKSLIRMGLRNMDKVYYYHTPDLYHTIYIMRKLNFELKWMQIPQLPQWDMNKTIQDFHDKNNIAFYNGKDELFDQNNGRFIVDPYEMIFVKR